MPLCNFLPIILSPSLKVEREDEEWAALQAPRCAQALATMRSFLPPDLATRTKADLVEVAQRECGLSLAKAQKDTVEILREKIKTVRKLRDTLDDPLAAPPVGLGKMKLAELQDEVLKRDLPLPPLRMLRLRPSDSHVCVFP
mgnify:CR=1 FL=1